MRLRVAKKVAKRHASGARYRQPTLDRASTRLKLAERLVPHPVTKEPALCGDLILDVPLAKVSSAKPISVTTDLTKMSVVELKALAKEQGRKGYSKMKKAELIGLLG